MLFTARWWSLALRGVLAILFGVLTLIWPGISLLALMILFGAFAIVNGAINLALSVRGPAGEARCGAMLFENVASIVAALGLKMRARMRHPERQVPAGGVPAHA